MYFVSHISFYFGNPTEYSLLAVVFGAMSFKTWYSLSLKWGGSRKGYCPIATSSVNDPVLSLDSWTLHKKCWISCFKKFQTFVNVEPFPCIFCWGFGSWYLGFCACNDGRFLWEWSLPCFPGAFSRSMRMWYFDAAKCLLRILAAGALTTQFL